MQRRSLCLHKSYKAELFLVWVIVFSRTLCEVEVSLFNA